MDQSHSYVLNNGLKIPAVGLGTWQIPLDKVEPVITEALKFGVRHIDCAAIYENEQEIGKALKKSGVARKELFITSKLWNSMHEPKDVEPVLRKTLADLQLEYLDLYLMHWPVAFISKRDGTNDSVNDPATGHPLENKSVTIVETWRTMETLVGKGLVRSIGVSNYSVRMLKELLPYVKIQPAVNQVEMHPYLPQNELLEYANAQNIHVTAYSPFGSGKRTKDIPSLFENETITEIAQKHNVSAAQVLISWGLKRKTSVVAKTATVERAQENFQIFELPDMDFHKINGITQRHRFIDPVEFWAIDVFGDKNEKLKGLEHEIED
ncbi:hypothetical protein HK098_004954 [Nowakowskiella sp. JEL0407]|nr:hypothetical protein HK098_004954 [Nowakowskiella sp. JEL0407]